MDRKGRTFGQNALHLRSVFSRDRLSPDRRTFDDLVKIWLRRFKVLESQPKRIVFVVIDTVKMRWIAARLMRGRGGDFLSKADRVHELAPGERSSSRPAVYLEADLEKIRKIEPRRSWDIEQVLIKGAPMDHRPTLSYEMSDVLISGAYLYKGGLRGRYGASNNGLLGAPQGEWRELDSAQLVTCRVGSEHFGHFMWDNLPMELLPGPRDHPITLSALPRWHEEGYRKVFGMAAPPVVARGRVKKLTIYSDVGQNAFRAARYQELRERARRFVCGDGPLPDRRGVYIMRGRGGEHRELVNEVEIARELKAEGFVIIDPDKMGGEEITRLSMGARVVAGVEGSHIAHALFSVANNGSFLIIQPPDRFSMVYKEFTDRLGLSYAFLVGDPVDNGFKVEPDRLKRLLERL